ncbi:hypothetical protein Rsub_05654 [Raphidocelis subcapitata]|uniref:MYND-type domain-containing protein n=1 Tax=Raphidocelis subcapitata TaxID=307507 RepID=A0A2V0P5A8_9CHLO|nr:hypothetical protein Rsub_05654 [Raphidocelis subcapitata]|eukprot:GBF93043.1 hypothetical protein Rsub_05654 [Raphidocelis subcapitata]
MADTPAAARSGSGGEASSGGGSSGSSGSSSGSEDGCSNDGSSSSSSRGAEFECLAWLLQELGDAPEVRELVGDWELRAQALLDAAYDAGGVLDGAAGTAAGELLQPLLSEAFVTAHPDLFDGKVGPAVSRTVGCCCSEGFACFMGHVAAGLLALFLSEQLSAEVHEYVSALLAYMTTPSSRAAALLAAPGTECAVEALIAVATGEGEGEGQKRDDAVRLLTHLAAADAAAAARGARALLPEAVERVQSAADAGAASGGTAAAVATPLALVKRFVQHAPAAACATPGLLRAAIGLLVALGSNEWAAAREEAGAACVQLEADVAALLASLLGPASAFSNLAVGALAPRGALPRLLALLLSPDEDVRFDAGRCIAAVTITDAGGGALLKLPRAAVQLATAMRRAHADGEDPRKTQFCAASALASLANHRGRSEAQRVIKALTYASTAEGGAGSLLGALAGLAFASVDTVHDAGRSRWNMCAPAADLTMRMVQAATAEQLRVLRRSSLLAEACASALRHWPEDPGAKALPPTATNLVLVLAVLAGFDRGRMHGQGAGPPVSADDTAAARSALQGAPGLEAVLRRCLSLGRREASTTPALKPMLEAGKFLLRLPEVKAAATAAATQAAAPPAGSTAALAPAAAALPLPPAAAGERAVVQQPEPPAGSSGADGSLGSGAEAAAIQKVCGKCGNGAAEAPLLRCVACKAQYYCGDACATAHWPAHRKACKAARVAAAGQRSQP